MATNALLDDPEGVAVDAAGNLFIADEGYGRIRRVDAATGIITTVASTGEEGFGADGGPATNALLNNPGGVAVDAAGNLFIADEGNDRVRRMDARTGIITSVAGAGEQGFAGDGGPATHAQLDGPGGIAADVADNLFIADLRNRRIRAVRGVATPAAQAAKRAPIVEATLTVYGEVSAVANYDKTAIDEVTLLLISAAQTSDAVDLASVGTVVTYLINNKAVNCGASEHKCAWSATWIIGSGPLVDHGDWVELKFNLRGLIPRLGLDEEFTIKIKPNKGPIVIVNTLTPAELKAINSLYLTFVPTPVPRSMEPGLEETSVKLTLRGAVIAVANSDKTAIDEVKFTLTSAAQMAEAVDLYAGRTMVTYLDDDQAVNCKLSGTPVAGGPPTG